MKEYRDMELCDLRQISTLKEAQSIELIRDVRLLVLPKDGDPEVLSALSAIPMQDVGKVLHLERDAVITSQNGMLTLGSGNVAPGTHTLYQVNGVVVVEDIPETAACMLMLNGILVQKKMSNAKIQLISMNGLNVQEDFEHLKVFQGKVELDAETLSYLGSKTLVIAGGIAIFDDDVTVEQLQEKGFIFICGGLVVCSKTLMPYLRATATIGGKLLESGTPEAIRVQEGEFEEVMSSMEDMEL